MAALMLTPGIRVGITLSQGIAGGDLYTSESPSDTRFTSLMQKELILMNIQGQEKIYLSLHLVNKYRI